MLNPDLKLNPDLFKDTVEKKATREGFGEALLRLGKTNPNIVVLTADLAESTKVDEFALRFPKRFFECGVAEQNMAAIAAGLAISGKIPFICSFAVFSPGKNLETIRTTIAYNKANVKIAGHHAGIITGTDGATHQATEDIALMRTLPNMSVYSPCDFWQAQKITELSAVTDNPVYIRLTREKTPVITSLDTPLEENRIRTFWISKNPQVVIFATGYLVYYALLAAKNLEEEGIDVLVANVCTIKPLDENSVISLAEKCGAAVTCEDHQIAGGMGSAVSECLSKNYPVPMEFIGLKDTFAESGSAKELIEKYKLSDIAIKKAVKKVLIRKS